MGLSGTVFEEFMGPFSTINLWSMVSKYIPYLLLLIIICNILNVWKYLLRCT